MTIQVYNFTNNDDVVITEQNDGFQVATWKKDLSVTRETAMSEYFASKMNVHRRQLICNLAQSGVTLQAGAMQWMAGDVQQKTGVKGVGDLIAKSFRGQVTGESAIKPEYFGTGMLVCEPTYKHILLLDIRDWGGGIVLADELFLACYSSLEHQTIMRNNVGSAIGGGMGLFNLMLSGAAGIIAIESNVPRDELITIDLNNDQLKIDGPLAIAWSPSLQFTVERSGKSLIGSAASGEGLVNVYRGTGRILMMPTQNTMA